MAMAGVLAGLTAAAEAQVPDLAPVPVPVPVPTPTPTATPTRAAAESVELHVALGVAPTGLAGVRLSVPIVGALRLEPGVGVGASGTVGSLVLALPVLRTQPTPTRWAQLLLYGGYAASFLSDDQRTPLAAAQLPNGVYQWLDLGVAAKTNVRGLLLVVGGGISRRMSAPAGLGADPREDDELWPLSGEGWITHRKTMPAFWCSVGKRF